MINYKVATILWAIFILLLSITPGNYIPAIKFQLLSIDTFVHVFFYLILSYLALKINKQKTFNFRRMFTIVLCVLYGTVIEYIQGKFISGRFFDYGDIYANSIGVILGVVIFYSQVKITKTQ